MQLFLRGIVLPFQKGQAVGTGIEDLTVSRPVRIPLAAGGEEHPLTAVGDNHPLAQGEELCRADDLPVLSTVAGTLSGTVMLQHTLYGELLCAEVQPEGVAVHTIPTLTDEEATPAAILKAAQDAAIYDELDGMPLAEKLARWQLPADDSTLKDCLLVADATENDVFGSSAWAVLEERAEDALIGLQLAARCLGFEHCHIATMLPRPMRRAIKHRIGRENLYIVGDEYPVTVFADGQDEVYRIGIQACLALADACRKGQRHTHTVVTVAGDALPASRNVRVPFGTDMQDLLELCGAPTDAQVIFGDAMTGVVCEDTHSPLLPGITTILVMNTKPVRVPGPCMGCGRCAAVCHARLLPYEIARRLENMHYERLQHLSASECDGCGACSYVCPAGRHVAAEVLQAGQTRGTMFMHWGEDDHE